MLVGCCPVLVLAVPVLVLACPVLMLAGPSIIRLNVWLYDRRGNNPDKEDPQAEDDVASAPAPTPAPPPRRASLNNVRAEVLYDFDGMETGTLKGAKRGA